jgi:hypothetical protein
MISGRSHRSMARVFSTAMVALHVFFWWGMRTEIGRGDPDFTAFYGAAKLVRAGDAPQIYDPAAQYRVQKEFTANADLRHGPLRYIHPPFEVLLFVPFSLIPYRVAFVLWDVLNVLLVIVVAHILRRSVLSGTDVRTWEIALGFFAFFPVFMNFSQGQDALLLLLFVALAYAAMKRGANFLGGVWLGMGLFRFHLIIPLVLILAWWGRRRIVSGFALAAAALFGVSLVLVGWTAMIRYPAYLWAWSSVPGLGRTPASLLPSVMGLVTGWPGISRAQWLLRSLVLIASAGLLIMVGRMKKAAQDPELFGLSFSCAILVAALVGYNTSAYDLALIALPVLVIGRSRLAESPVHWRRGATLPVLPLLISPFWFVIGMYWHKFNLVAVLLLWWLFAMRKEVLLRCDGVREPQTVSRLA